MKYLVFTEYNWKDQERILELRKQLGDERTKGSDKWPKSDQILFETHQLYADFMQSSKNVQQITVIELENPMHLINYRMHFAPYMDIKFIPIASQRKGAEAWMGWNR